MSNEVKTKVCIKCGKELPVTSEYFYKNKTTKDGFKHSCKACEFEYMKQYRLDHKESISSQCKRYFEMNKKTIKRKRKHYIAKHKEEFAESRRKRYKSHREEEIEQAKQYYKENKDKSLEQKKQYYQKNKEIIAERVKKYHEKAKDKIAARSKIYREENREKISQQAKEWKLKNKDKMAEYKRKNKHKWVEYGQLRKAKIRQLPHTLTNKQWEQIKQYFDNKCSYCGKELPLAQEHFIPLSKGGEYTVNNIICSCISCNSSKKDKNFFEWYPKYRYYSKKREKKILDFLGYKDDKQQLSLII